MLYWSGLGGLGETWTRATNYIHTKYHATCTYVRIQYNHYMAEPPRMSDSYEIVRRTD